MASPVEPGPGLRVPDFFIVGHPKCGTTALYEMLRSHPQIYMPAVKEPQFFATDLRLDARQRAGDTAPRSRFPATYAEYLSLFEPARADQIVGEATPAYLRSHVAADAIAAVQPAARIIAILREPASLLRSQHLQWLKEHIETEPDFMKALALERDRRNGVLAPGEKRQAQMLLYSEFIHYVEQLCRYENVFPRAQMLVLIYDDFKRENEQTVRRVLRFLGVDDTIGIAPVTANRTVAVRSLRLERLVRHAQLGHGRVARPARAIITALTPAKPRRRLFYPLRRRVIYRAPEPVDERAMTELRRRLKPEVEALGDYLNRDLVALWGYQSSD